MFQAAGVAVHEFAPASEYWYATLATPEPPMSLATDVRLTVPSRFAPGSTITARGGVLSTRRKPTTVEAVWLPAPSVATVRKSYRPSISVVVSSEAE